MYISVFKINLIVGNYFQDYIKFTTDGKSIDYFNVIFHVKNLG